MQQKTHFTDSLLRIDRRLFAYYRDWARTRFWLIPATMCLAALSTALLCLYVDRNVDQMRPLLPSFTLDTQSARNLMGIVATSVIGVGGVSFSITMVALSLTSGQYGPKVLRQFLSSYSSKISLGMFFSTAIFSIAVFVGIGSGEVPRLSVLVAIGLAGTSLIEFMRFVHRTTSDLQADKIIQRLGVELKEHLHALAILGSQNDTSRSSRTEQWRRSSRSLRCASLKSTVGGYIQTIDHAGLLLLLESKDATAILTIQPGDFLVSGETLLRMRSATSIDTQELEEELGKIVTTGPVRTAVEDPQFPITQIQQIAARALSPGVNDPGTAISCIDSLTQALTEIVDARLPGAVLADSKGKHRLLTKALSFPALIDFTFSPTRLLIGANLTVADCLLHSLERLARITTCSGRREVLCRQGTLLMERIRREELSDYDTRELERMYQRLARIS